MHRRAFVVNILFFVVIPKARYTTAHFIVARGLCIPFWISASSVRQKPVTCASLVSWDEDRHLSNASRASGILPCKSWTCAATASQDRMPEAQVTKVVH
ncbi:hypothetical protein C8J57DRAFT_1342649 [Mycena rebaudengoi]|nr:hypothetical protein C8J57DRAFT_1342649 [Mycena rebaudengoi]